VIYRTEEGSHEIYPVNGERVGEYVAVNGKRASRWETLYHRHHATFEEAKRHLIELYNGRILQVQRKLRELERIANSLRNQNEK
jgi:hypothetical protein